MVKRYVVIDTDDSNPSDMDLELGPVYEESEAVGSADAYLSDAEADNLMVSRPAHSAWTAATADQKNEALKEATRRIDSMILRGNKYDSDQALEFPRIIDGVTVGNADQDAEVPASVSWACLEEAMTIIGAGSSGGRQALQAQGVASYQIPGIISETFVAGFGSVTLQSPRARQIMRRFTGADVR